MKNRERDKLKRKIGCWYQSPPPGPSHPSTQHQVVLDETGTSKGFGFIRFGNETEQQTALTTMQGIAGLGAKPIKVSIAVQKAKDPNQHHTIEYPASVTQTIQRQLTGQTQYAGTAQPALGGGNDYSAYYSQYNSYWSNMAAWQQYNQYYSQYPGQDPSMLMNPPLPNTPSTENGLIDEHVMHQMDTTHQQLIEEDEISIFDGPANEPVDHSKPLDYYKLDRKYFARSAELYDSIEESGWYTA